MEGTNGEQIICSPYEDASYPEVTLPEYVWRNLNKYSNRVAVVSKNNFFICIYNINHESCMYAVYTFVVLYVS